MEYTFYIITCKDENIPDCYVGSTIDFERRKKEHLRWFNDINTYNRYNFYVYQFIRENGGWDNWEFGILGIHSFDNKKNALNREQYYIESYDAKLNSRNAKKNENYYKNRREIVLAYLKNYREKKKIKILLEKQQYRQKNKEKIALHKKEWYYKKKEQRLMALNDYRV